MAQVRVAIVSRDPELRLAAARAFDGAPPDWSISLWETPGGDADVVVVAPDVDDEGDVLFDPGDPQGVLEAVERAARSAVRRVVVTGAAGGAGATTVAVHLAAMLAERTEVLYIDADPTFGGTLRLGLDDLLDQDPEEHPPVPVAGGFSLSRSTAAAPLAAGIVVTDFPAVVFDAAAIADAAAMILVVPPTAPGATRARRVLETAGIAAATVVTNRTGRGGELTRAQIEGLLGRAVDLELPFSALLRDREDTGALLLGGYSRWTSRLRRLAAAVPCS